MSPAYHHYLNLVVPGAGIEPARGLAPRDFKTITGAKGKANDFRQFYDFIDLFCAHMRLVLSGNFRDFWGCRAHFGHRQMVVKLTIGLFSVMCPY